MSKSGRQTVHLSSTPDSVITGKSLSLGHSSEKQFYEESSLPLSILDDYKSAASETEYEISENTRRVYLSSYAIFDRYCHEHGLSPLPADPRTLISFIGHQKESIQQKTGAQLSRQTLTTRLAAIRYQHIQAGYHSPTEHPLVIRVMRGLSRNKYRKVSDYDQQPIMYDELEMLLNVIEQHPQPLIRARDKAIIQLGFQGGFRRSELADIQVNHLTFLRNKLKVRLPYSKSNQQGQREWKDLPQSEPFAAYDAVKNWIEISKVQQGHLFRSISRDGSQLRPYSVSETTNRKINLSSDDESSTGTLKRNSGFLRGDDIYQMIKRYCQRSGLSPEFYGAHSLRSGCVTQLHENDKDHLYIMARTGHTDPRSLRHYLKPKD
ncbi:tyrosine-type recombinase/integrase [uncultured Shewanella sp.]|uniref:tyrosine-type recombinase/integrase n=1 Tax=uncultured Shewanella sp. TaxID=173975 RepID=UPI0026090886|nr:tyrosine-type recombinase/integrase [uncultured Shewanella sp.]